MTLNVYADAVNVYTLEQMADFLGVDTDHFENAVEEVAYPKTQPVRYKLKKPIDIGERTKAKFVGYVKGQGYALFPSIASLKLWLVDQPENWEANAVA